jgi:hypothetical protein
VIGRYIGVAPDRMGSRNAGAWRIPSLCKIAMGRIPQDWSKTVHRDESQLAESEASFPGEYDRGRVLFLDLLLWQITPKRRGTIAGIL